MRIESHNSDEVVLAELGARLARTRLERNLDQRQLAGEAGIAKRTVERLEAGEPVTMSSFVRVVRALGLLDRLDQLAPEPLPSPLERLKTHGERRRRASGSRGAPAEPGRAERAGGWTWNDPPGSGNEG